MLFFVLFLVEGEGGVCVIVGFFIVLCGSDDGWN